MQKHITDKPNYNTLTKEQLALGIIKTKKEVRKLEEELEKVKSYLREQHKLKKELENKISAIDNFLKIENSVFQIKRK